MQARRLDIQRRRWLEDLLYYMMERNIDYVYTFHNLETISVGRPFALFGDLPVPACVGLDKDTGKLTLLVYHPLVSRLPERGQLAMLKHEAIHVMDGHFSSYGIRLIEKYGPLLANMATDCYVNQKPFEGEMRGSDYKVITTIGQVLEEAGLSPVTIERYGLPPGLTSEQYAELLKDQVDQSTQPRILKEDDDKDDGESKDKEDPQAGTTGKPGENFTGKGQFRPSEVFDISGNEAAQADHATKEVITNVRESIAKHGEDQQKTMGRGFGGADQDQFFEALQRQATVPWYYFLRMAETKHRAEIVVPTRRRLSRRSPFHLGRVRQYGLEIAFMVDTSGSMGKRQLELVDPELRGLYYRGAHIVVIHCDAAVAKVETYNPFEPLERFRGRGGTEFSDALFKVRELSQRPGLFVGFTDGYGGVETYMDELRRVRGRKWVDEFLSRQPTVSPDGIETIWLIPEDCRDLDDFRSDVPWGTVIEVPAAEKAPSVQQT